MILNKSAHGSTSSFSSGPTSSASPSRPSRSTLCTWALPKTWLSSTLSAFAPLFTSSAHRDLLRLLPQARACLQPSGPCHLQATHPRDPRPTFTLLNMTCSTVNLFLETAHIGQKLLVPYLPMDPVYESQDHLVSEQTD